MPMAIKAKKTLDMNMMQRHETPPRMDKDLLEELFIKAYMGCLDLSPMVVLELGPPHGGFQEGLEGASKIDEAVAHEEEHTQKRSEGVHIANEYGHLVVRIRIRNGKKRQNVEEKKRI